MADLSLAEVIDLDELQRTLEDFSDATGLATVGVDTRGIPVTWDRGLARRRRASS
ncbi:MAG TPA: PocR ligand-binding domain-containing protein [Propionicimonas sp.]|nr:PocR ligand-binding domain-containing protein [Propionicimonas sp.]